MEVDWGALFAWVFLLGCVAVLIGVGISSFHLWEESQRYHRPSSSYGPTTHQMEAETYERRQRLNAAQELTRKRSKRVADVDRHLADVVRSHHWSLSRLDETASRAFLSQLDAAATQAKYRIASSEHPRRELDRFIQDVTQIVREKDTSATRRTS